MDVLGETYHVSYNHQTKVVTFSGVLRIRQNDEDAPIAHLLQSAAEQTPSTITLDLQKLEVMNSTGFGLLIKFMKEMRTHPTCCVIIKGNKNFFWQRDLLVALQRLAPGSELEWH